MKQILFSILIVAAAFTIGCGSKATTPKAVTEQYLTAMFHADFEAAKKISTDECKTLIEAQKSFFDLQADSSKAQYKKIKWQVTGEPVITGNNAMATFTESDMPGNRTLPLLLVDGKWLVNNNKAHLEKQMDADMPEGEGEEAIPMATDSVNGEAQTR
jgi:hypothetical protein